LPRIAANAQRLVESVIFIRQYAATESQLSLEYTNAGKFALT